MLISDPIEKVHASWHDMCGATHTRDMFQNTEKP